MMDSAESTPSPRSHSKIGIAAFVTSLLPLAILACYLTALFIDLTTKLSLSEILFSPVHFYLIAAPLCVLLSLVSLVLGIGSFFQKGYRKALPILGVIVAPTSCLLWTLAFVTILIYSGA